MSSQIKLILAKAAVDYSGCYYEGDQPNLDFSAKEVSLEEAIREYIEEEGISVINSVLHAIFKSQNMKEKYNKKYVEEVFNQYGYIKNNAKNTK